MRLGQFSSAVREPYPSEPTGQGTFVARNVSIPETRRVAGLSMGPRGSWYWRTGMDAPTLTLGDADDLTVRQRVIRASSGFAYEFKS